MLTPIFRTFAIFNHLYDESYSSTVMIPSIHIISSNELMPEEEGKRQIESGQSKKLCPNCQRLELSIEKFIIYDGSPQAFKNGPPGAQFFPGDGQHGSGTFQLKSGTPHFKLGTFAEIAARRKTCPFCLLVIKSIEQPDPTSDSLSDVADLDGGVLKPMSTCYVNWEIDGRENNQNAAPRARTRRLHLHWDNEKLRDSYLVFVAPKRLFEFNSDSQGSWGRDAFFLARKITRDGNNHVLMKSWLDQCSQTHGENCASDSGPAFAKMASRSYFGVIDVLDMCLKSLPCRKVIAAAPTRGRSRSGSSYSDEEDGPPNSSPSLPVYAPFVALSYVWGKGKNFTTTKANVRVHQQQGSLAAELNQIPRVIRDAMDLVRRLGLRFLWVDSLCIVQDSARSWNLNSKMMNLIYGNACLTICAADGFDASTGLKAADALRPPVAQHIEECAPGVGLMVSQLAETGIGASIWNTRAWTFQERMLSKRCIIFTEGRVFYQCRSATMSEDLVSESHGIGWSLDLAKALPQVLNDLKGRPIRVYMNCVSQYSTRKLTQPSDILAAFNGVSNLIGQHMQAPFIFGLPSSHFDLALLWEPLKAVTRRVEQKKEDFKGLVFPSWSWCGWRGEPVSYRNSQIEGCLTNVSEWLTKHTWIAWYIRDGRGNLRPIWHGQKSRVSGHVEDRWKGYKNHPADRDYERFQENASQNLGRAFENDLNNWAKEEELARIQKIPKLPLVPPPTSSQATIIRRGDGNPYDSYERAQRPQRRELEREVIRERPREGVYYEEDARGFSDDVDGPRVSHHHRRRSPELEVPNEELKTRTFNDEYGRDLSQEMAQKPRKAFQQCLPENPFRVFMEEYITQPDKDFPDQPLLQFWTWHASLRLTKSHRQVVESKGLCLFDIADDVGDWCGSILLDKNWLEEKKKNGDRVEGSKRDFLAVSDARAFTKEECDVWNYYVPKEQDNSEWDLYYVLLVEQTDHIWYRVALGKVFKAAFENVAPPKKWREIIMG